MDLFQYLALLSHRHNMGEDNSTEVIASSTSTYFFYPWEVQESLMCAQTAAPGHGSAQQTQRSVLLYQQTQMWVWAAAKLYGQFEHFNGLNQWGPQYNIGMQTVFMSQLFRNNEKKSPENKG